MKEWKRIPLKDFLPEGTKLNRRKVYEISVEGKIRSIDMAKIHREGELSYSEVQTIEKGNNKYFVVYAGMRGGVVSKSFIPVHKIMAHVFIKPLSKDEVVEFKEGNELKVENLKIVNVGARNDRIKLMRSNGATLEEIAKKVRLNKSQVSQIIKRR